MNTNVEGVKATEVKNKVAKKDGVIRVTNKGAFIANAGVSYRLNGELVIKKTRDLPVMQDDTLIIPADATNIEFSVIIAIYFETWRIIYYTTFDSVPTKCYNLYGITLYAECVEVSCGDNDNGSNNPMIPIVIPPYNCGCPCRCCCNYCCNPQYYNPYISSYNSLGEGYGYNYYY